MSHPSPAQLLTVVDASPGEFWFGASGTFNVVVWLRAGTLEMVTRVDRSIAVRYEAVNKQKMSTVHVIVADVPPPDAAARTALIEMNESWGHAVACGAVVIERGGLVGIALRSAVTGIIILAPKHYRVKVFDAFEPCAPWVADQHMRVTSNQLDPAELLKMLHHARRAAAS